MALRPRIALAALLVAAGCIRTVPEPALAGAFAERASLVTVRFTDPSDAAIATQVERVLPAALTAAARWGPLRERVTITIHPTHAALEAAARKPGFAWLRAWARLDAVDVQSPRTWSTGRLSDGELEQLLVHELTHCAMYQSLGRGAPAARSVPIWFREGMASVAAGERHGPVAGGAGVLATASASYRTSAALAYATADSAFRLLIARHGEDAVRGILARLRAGEPFPAAFRAATGISPEAFEAEYARAAGEAGGES